MSELIAYPKYSYVLEGTSTACTNCGDAHGVNVGFWFDVAWLPGTYPDFGRTTPRLVVCTACLEAAGAGQLVGPELAR